MNIILTLLLVILIFILLILFIPVKYNADVKYQDEFTYAFQVGWGSLLRFVLPRPARQNKLQLKFFGISFPKSKNQLSPDKNRPERKQIRGFWGLKVLQSFLENRLQVTTWELLKQLLLACKPHEIMINGQYGFYEPHFTAWLLPCLSLVDGMDKAYIVNLNPVWDREYLEISIIIAGSITPALLLSYIIKFVLQASTWRFLLAVRKNKKTVQPC